MYPLAFQGEKLVKTGKKYHFSLLIWLIDKYKFVSMLTTVKCTHKIALIDRSGIGIFNPLSSMLQEKGILSQLIDVADLDSDLLIDTQVLFIRLSELTRNSLSSLRSSLPELAGVLAVYKDGVRKYQVLQDTAAARSERVAVIGALFISEEGSDRGRTICREVGIPYLGNGVSSSSEKVIQSLESDALVRLFS